MGHCWSGEVPKFDPQLFKRCELCNFGVRYDKTTNFLKPENMGEYV